MFGFFQSRCQICGNAIKRVSHLWKLEGKKVRVCTNCNSRLESRKSAEAFGKAVDYPVVAKSSRGCGCLSIVGILAIAAIVIMANRPENESQRSSPSNPPPDANNESSSSGIDKPEVYTDKAAQIPDQSVEYKILNRSEMGSVKLSLDVEVSLIDGELPSAEQLEKISRSLVSKEGSYDRSFVVFYLPGMEVGAGGFATAHHDPDVSVRFLLVTLVPYPEYHRFLSESLREHIRTEKLEAFGAEVRTWRSLDGRDLTGRLSNFDIEAGTVTIIREDGRIFEGFKLEDLHHEDRALIMQVHESHEAPTLEPSAESSINSEDE